MNAVSPVVTCDNSLRVGQDRGTACQFGHPSGWVGAVVGHLMAVKNLPMNRLVVELLDVKPEDAVLEIGFGPGQAIKLLVERTPAAIIAGIDPSAVMVRQATRRNRQWIATKRLELHLASVASIPLPDGSLTKAFAVNSFHHWDNQRQGLMEVRRVLRPGGTLLLCLRMHLPKPWWGSAPGLTDEQVEQAEQMLRETGFEAVRSAEHSVGRRVVCLTGRSM